jgi:predicted transcriptional regulator
MESLPVKVPADLMTQLQHRADRLGCSRAALARDLVAQGLERLESAAAIDGEVA